MNITVPYLFKRHTLLACLLLLISPALLQAQVQLLVGMEQNPPICSIDASGKPNGISVDILNEISRKEGWQISYVSCIWEQCLRDLAAKKLDLLLGIGHTAEREKLYDFSRETSVVNWAQVYASKNMKVVSPVDLAGKRIALVPTDLHGAAFLDTLQRFSIDAHVVRVESYGEALKAVINTTADAGVVSRIFPIPESESAKLLKTPIIFNPIHSKFAAPKGQHQQVLQAIDRHLADMKADKGSSYYRILENRLGVPGKAGIPGWVIWLLLGSAALLALLSSGNVLCRRRIRKRTSQLEHEVTRHQETSRALQHREEQLNTVIATTGEGYLLMDNQLTMVLDVNAAFCRLLGYQREEVLRTQPIHFVAKENHEVCRRQMTFFESGGQRNFDMELLHRDGRIITVHCNTTKLPEEHGFNGNIFAFVTDISERKQYEDQLQHQAHHDMLTGLPNRLLLYDRIEQAILHGQRYDSFLVLSLLDLVNFKVVNDTLGHSTGDQLLQAFTERTRAVLRQGDTFARLGGDEFVILPESIGCNQDIVLVTQRIFNTLATPFDIGGYELYVTASIGISRYPDDGSTADALLKHADAAMYLAKREGKNDFRFFTRDLDTKMHERLSLESRLRRALERQEFELNYQPQVTMETGRVIGFEALLRWRYNGDLISPAEFIPVLEETGLILPVGEWILQTACAEAARWQSSPNGQLKVSVNLSARQFQHQDLVGQIARILDQTGLKPQRLVLELTESLLMECGRETLIKLEKLATLGVTLSIDDFGTGYSSLSYLANLPIHELKIDRSFVGSLPQDENNAAIVQAITALASALRLHVVVEGVESVEQVVFLKTAGLDTAQGFLYSRPMPASMMQSMMLEMSPLCIQR